MQTYNTSFERLVQQVRSIALYIPCNWTMYFKFFSQAIDQTTLWRISWITALQRTRGPAGLSTVFEITGPDQASSPPLGGSPIAGQSNDFNAAAYLQRKSALHPKDRLSETVGSTGWVDPLDHRIHQSEQQDSDSELQFEDRPLLDSSKNPI